MTMTFLTRRDFLKGALAAGTCACLGEVPGVEASVFSPDATRQIGVLVDTTRCIGCRACVRACNQRNGLSQAEAAMTVWEGETETPTYGQWTVVNLEGRTDGKGAVPVKRQCMHCLNPACVSVCPVGALHRLPSGAVIYRKDRCIGCRYCVFACPFNIPKFQWDSGETPVVGKCQFCAQHPLFTGPACAAVCPTGALKFGARQELLFEARARIHGRPDRYVDHIYGEKEVGGTSWLYLAGRDFEDLGFKSNLPTTPLPLLTQAALGTMFSIVGILALVLASLSYLLKETTRQGRA